VINTAKVEPNARIVVFGLGGIGLNAIQGHAHGGRRDDRRINLNPNRCSIAEEFGMTHFLNPTDVAGDLVPYLVDLTKGGADCEGVRRALECVHRGWGQSIIIGVAGAGQEISTRPFQLVTERVLKDTTCGGTRGHTDVPGVVDWLDGRINIDDLITHVLPRALQ